MSYRHIPQLRGFDISIEESECYKKNYIDFYKTKELKNSIIPIISIAAPSYCNYRCIYCISDIENTRPSELKNYELKNILDVGLLLGTKTIEIAGAGEPTLWTGLKPLISMACERRYTIVVFTNNSVICEDNGLLEFFFEHDVSLVLKFNSFNSHIHNYLTNCQDADDHKKRALKKIMDLGYNKGNPLRVGIETIICSHNLEEIPKLWRFARDNNLFPFFETLHYAGKAVNMVPDIPASAVYRLFNDICELDNKEYGYRWKPTPPYLGFNCSLCDHIHIDENGNICPCVEFFFNIGNIKNEDFISILKRSAILFNIRKSRDEFFEPISRLCHNGAKLFT